MPDSDAYTSPDESLQHLYRSSWTMGELTFIGTTDRGVFRVYGSNGENQIRVEGSTPATS